MSVVSVCGECGRKLVPPIVEAGSQPVEEIAKIIADGGVFTSADAVRVAREYIAVTGIGTAYRGGVCR